MATTLKFVATHNVAGYLLDPPASQEDFRSMIAFLRSCCITHALSFNPVIYRNMITEFWTNARIIKDEADEPRAVESTMQGAQVTITEQKIRTTLRFGDQSDFPSEIPSEEIVVTLEKMCYEGSYPPTTKKLLPPFWRFLTHTFMNCISGRKGGSDEIPKHATSAIIALILERDFNYSKFVFKEMISNLLAKRKGGTYLMYPRFLQMIFDVEYPLLERTGDTLYLKAMGPSSFALIRQARASGSVSYQYTKPLVKFGRFADGQEQVAAPVFNAPVINAPVEDVVDVNTAPSALQPSPQPYRQMIIEEAIDISDDEDVKAELTTQELRDLIDQYVSQAPQSEMVPNSVQVTEMTTKVDILLEEAWIEDIDRGDDEQESLITSRKRKRDAQPADAPIIDSDAQVSGIKRLYFHANALVSTETEHDCLHESETERNPSPIVDPVLVDQPQVSAVPEDSMRFNLFKDVEGPSLPDLEVPEDTGFVAGSSSMPSGSSLHRGKNIYPDSEFINIPMLQTRLFELEQQVAAEDVQIGELDGRMGELEKANKTLQEGLDSQANLLVDLKQRLAKQFGKAFSDAATPSSRTMVRTPAPRVNIDTYLAAPSMTGEERCERQRVIDARSKQPEAVLMRNSDQNKAAPNHPGIYMKDMAARFGDIYGNRSGVNVWGYNAEKGLWFVKRKNLKVEYYENKTDFCSFTKVDLSELVEAPFHNETLDMKAWTFKKFLENQKKVNFAGMKTANPFLKKAEGVTDTQTKKPIKNVMWPLPKRSN